MKVAMTVAALAAAWTAVPARAAEPIGPKTVVQVDHRAVDFGYAPFDTSLGLLLSVRLDITARFQREFVVFAPGILQSTTVSWDAGAEPFCRYGACTNLIASGSQDVALRYDPYFLGGSSAAILRLNFSSPTITSYLDVEQFISGRYTTPYFTLSWPDPGLYDDSLLDIFNVANGVSVRPFRDRCRNSIAGCDMSLYQLTYIYAPGGVPEPATWATIIAGFGMIGGVIRNLRRTGLKAVRAS